MPALYTILKVDEGVGATTQIGMNGLPASPFVAALSEWYELEYVQYLYAHGSVKNMRDWRVDDIRRYRIEWEVPEENWVWFVLKWGNLPEVKLE